LHEGDDYPKIEEMFDEIKMHLCDGRKVLRSKTPQLVRQEFTR